jgi:hypothetical protein
MRRAVVAAVIAVQAVPGALVSAQSAATGTVRGFVVDSIRGVPLANAFVALEGAGLGAATDSTGNFLITGVPAGTYRAALLHQKLDLLRMAVRTAEVTVSARDTLRLFLAIPSAMTVLRQRCGDSRAVADSSALFGVVTDADGVPAEGATVLLNWRELVVSRDAGVQEHERFRAAAVLPDGGFHICGLPDDLLADARVTRGADTSSTVPVRIPLTGLTTVELALPGGEREAVVRGRVLSRRGAPVAGVQLTLGDAVVTATTDSSGAFAFTAQPSGSQTLTARRIGYEMRELPLTVRRGETISLEVVLDEFVPLLEEVVVRARRDAALERVGFGLRARAGGGLHLTPAELERRSASRVSDYLVDAPMLRVTGSGSNRRVTGRRDQGGGCVAYVVDGRQWTGPHPDETFNPNEVAAIEVYSRGLAPALFLGVGSCEVVMIWTKRHLGLDR